MVKSKEPFNYEKWYGLTSDGGGSSQFAGASANAGYVASTKGGSGFSTKAGIGTCSSTKATVGPFDDERFTCYIVSYKNLDMSRWNALTSAGAKLLSVEEKLGDGSIVYQLYAGEDDADSDEMVSELLQLYNWERLTKWGVDEFERLVIKARQEFELIEILSQPEFLQLDTSLESVLERLPADLVTSVGYDFIKYRVEDHIRGVKGWEKKRLYYDFKSFLPDCHWITTKMDRSSAVTRLQEDVTFLERRFDMIPFPNVLFDFMCYIGHLVHYEVMGMVEEGKAAYKKQALRGLDLERLSLEKRKKRFPSQFSEPIHFLVFREREKQYIIQDPVVEVTKLQAFFHHFRLGDGSYIETTSPLMGHEGGGSISENDYSDTDDESQGEGQIFSYESYGKSSNLKRIDYKKREACLSDAEGNPKRRSMSNKSGGR